MLNIFCYEKRNIKFAQTQPSQGYSHLVRVEPIRFISCTMRNSPQASVGFEPRTTDLSICTRLRYHWTNALFVFKRTVHNRIGLLAGFTDTQIFLDFLNRKTFTDCYQGHDIDNTEIHCSCFFDSSSKILFKVSQELSLVM